MPNPPRIFKRKSNEIESAEQQNSSRRPFEARSSPSLNLPALPPPSRSISRRLNEASSSPSLSLPALPPPARSISRQPTEASSSPSVSQPVLPPSARPITKPLQQSRPSDSDALTSEKMKALQILQRDEPGDQEIVEKFLKGGMEYKFGFLLKRLLKLESLFAKTMHDSKASRKEADLRASSRPVIRQRLILARYDDKYWNNTKKVLVSFRSRQSWYACAEPMLADVQLDLDDDFSGLEAAARVVGKVRVEEKAKLKDRLLRAQDLLDQPLLVFASCVRCEAGNPQTEYVEDSSELWEAAARWRHVLRMMDHPREHKFWLEVDRIFMEMDGECQFFDKDVDEFGFYEGEYHEGEFDEGAGREEMVESSC